MEAGGTGMYEYLKDFCVEVKGYLEDIDAAIFEYGQNNNPEYVGRVFRSFHTIKGLAGFVDLNLIREIVHEIEGVADLFRKRKSWFDEEAIKLIYKTTNVIEKVIQDLGLCSDKEFGAKTKELVNEIREYCEKENKKSGDKKDNNLKIEITKPEIIKEEKNEKKGEEEKQVFPTKVEAKKEEVKKEIKIENTKTEPKKEVRKMEDSEVEKKEKSELKSQKYLTFAISVENYGIPIGTVKEIIGMMHITSIPKTPKFIKGVVNLRGKIIPIMDLRLKFGLTEKEYSERTCIIVAEINSSKGKRNIGVVVDAVSEVQSIEQSDIENVQQEDIRNEGNFITGIGKVKDRVIMLLDIDKILNEEDLKILNEMKGGK